MEFDDYESLPSSSTSTHMVAGAFAGIMEHCVMYPLDSVKTRMQSLRPNPKARYRNIPDAFYKIIRYEGVFRPIRGMSAVVTGAGPAHALYFSCYEKIKQVLSSPERRLQGAMVHGFAGCFSTLIHDAIMTPAEMIKQRMQMYGSPYKTCTECLTKVWKGEGIRAFYRSYTTQLTMNLPFQSIHFMTYEYMQDLTNHERTYNPKAHMMSGAIAGAFAAAVTTPLDVCKTLLNTQEKVLLSSTKYSHNHRINGLVSAAIAVYEHSGLRGYTQGMQARVIYQVPSTAIAWSVYEFFKYFIEKRHFSHRHEHNNPIVLQKTTIEDKPSHMLVTPLTIVYNE